MSLLAVQSSRFQAAGFSTNSLHSWEPVSVQGGPEGALCPGRMAGGHFLLWEALCPSCPCISAFQLLSLLWSSGQTGSSWAHPCDRWDCWGQGWVVWVPAVCELAEVTNPSRPNTALTSAPSCLSWLTRMPRWAGVVGAPFGFDEGQLCGRPWQGWFLGIARCWSTFSLRWGWPGWVRNAAAIPAHTDRAWGWPRHYRELGQGQASLMKAENWAASVGNALLDARTPMKNFPSGQTEKIPITAW